MDFRGVLPGFSDRLSYWTTLTRGIPGFFTPNPLAHAGDFYPLGADQAGYYSTAPLEATLAELVDFDLINDGNPRLTVGAAHVRSSQMTYFDSRRCKLDVRHIMASGALPPAFPAVRINGEPYWDGGILCNTPTEVVLDDDPIPAGSPARSRDTSKRTGCAMSSTSSQRDCPRSSAKGRRCAS